MERFSSLGARILTLFFLAVSASIAQTFEQPLQDVFQTDLVYPQEKGEVQLTLAPRFQKNPSLKLWEVPLEVEYGLTSAWQVSVEWTSYQSRRYASEDTVSGIGDFEVGTKYSFMNLGGSNSHAALGFDVTFPAGDVEQDLSEGLMEYAPSLMLAHDFVRWGGLQLFTQAGVSYSSREKPHADPEENEPLAPEFTWNTGFFLPWKNWRLTTEFNWTTNRWSHDGDEAEAYITPGMVYKLADDWEAGLATAIGLNEQADDYRVITQLVYEFQLFK